MTFFYFFQGHKFLHFLLPIILILVFKNKLGLIKICFYSFMAGFLKECYDTFVLNDPLWLSTADIFSNLLGIMVGMITSKIQEKLFARAKM